MKALPTAEPSFAPREGLYAPDLIPLLSLTTEEFRRRFRNSPIRRAKRRGLLRNVAVALGNLKSCEAVPALVRALDDEEALVRGHVAWALGRSVPLKPSWGYKNGGFLKPTKVSMMRLKRPLKRTESISRALD